MTKKKFFEVHHGTTRTVFLIGKYAIKIPLIKKYKGFLKGLVCNLTERNISTLCPNYFLPVLWSDPLGLFVIMPRAKVVKIDSWFLHAFMVDLFHQNNDEEMEALNARYYCEYNPANIGLYKGRPFCIDYGTYVHADLTEKDLEREMFIFKSTIAMNVNKQKVSNENENVIFEESVGLDSNVLHFSVRPINVESKNNDIPSKVETI